nr:hypothetical protein [Klebsiella quasipneumoniae]
MVNTTASASPTPRRLQKMPVREVMYSGIVPQMPYNSVALSSSLRRPNLSASQPVHGPAMAITSPGAVSISGTRVST